MHGNAVLLLRCDSKPRPSTAESNSPLFVSHPTEKPIEGVPGAQSQTDAVVDQQAAKAEETLEDFDITAAAKLVRKRYPIGPIISDEILMSDDEDEPDVKKPRVIPAEESKTDSKPADNGQFNAPAQRVIKKRNDSFNKPNVEVPATAAANAANLAKNKKRRVQRPGKPMGGIQSSSADNGSQNTSFDGGFANNDFTRRPNRSGNSSFNDGDKFNDNFNMRDNFTRMMDIMDRGDRGDNFNRGGGAGGGNFNRGTGFGNNDGFNRNFGNNTFGTGGNLGGGGRFNSRF